MPWTYLQFFVFFFWLLLVAPSIAFLIVPLHHHSRRHHFCCCSSCDHVLLTHQHASSSSSLLLARPSTTDNEANDDDHSLSPQQWQQQQQQPLRKIKSKDDNNDHDDRDSALTSTKRSPAPPITARIPTSVDDQVRQCVQSIQIATTNNNNNKIVRRHIIRLLLPLIGASDLDDWPGGARQMMEAAAPLVERIIRGLLLLGIDAEGDKNNNSIQKVCLDRSDGVYAWLVQAQKAKNDCAFVLLPTAESVKSMIKESLEQQVGPNRNIYLINPQWRRRADFGGGFFGLGGVDGTTSASYVEDYYQPTFSLTNLICEGESIRVLHTHGSGWFVYVRRMNGLENARMSVEDDRGDNWVLIGEKPFIADKPANWQQLPGNDQDGGRLFDYGLPTYQEISAMLLNSPNYTPKTPAERAATAFGFSKDTL